MKFLPDIFIDGGLAVLSLQLFALYGDWLSGLFERIGHALASVS